MDIKEITIEELVDIAKGLAAGDPIKDILKNEQVLVATFALWTDHGVHYSCHRFFLPMCNGVPEDICPFYKGTAYDNCTGFPHQYTEEDLSSIDTEEVKKLLSEKKISYTQYLLTLHWKKVRKLALEKAEGKCQLCNKSNCLNVHHRTYEHLGDEQNHLSDLTVLCKDCHSNFHFPAPNK